MSTLVADPPATAQAPSTGSPAPASPAPADQAAPETRCANCASPMAAAQDWCLHCGAGAAGSLSGTAHRWRSGGIVAAVVVLLVAGAAAAAYAAWGKGSHSRRPTTALARSLAPGAAGTPLAGTPGARALPGASAAVPAPGLGRLAKPPKIPLKQITPKVTPLPSTAVTPVNTVTTQKAASTPTTSAGGSRASELPPAIELDTNAASTYDPYAYPATNFGEPTLAIDGDTTTGWTAQLDPAVAPRMAEGLSINLRSPRRIADIKLYTSTPGMTVQVYGANGHTLPSSITEKAWVPLSHAMIVNKKSTTIKLRDATKGFSFIALWISRAPASAVGTPQAPGHVVVDELELFPPK